MQVHELGFVRLVDSMGNDTSIVQAARKSYDEGSKGEKADAKLINYLMKNGHTSPFEQVQFKFHVKAPIFVARQWMRHRTGSFNELSGRYTEFKEQFYVPTPDYICGQSEDNKQASGAPLENAQKIAEDMYYFYKSQYARYQWLLHRGVSRETARQVLPVAMYTEFYWSVNLHNLLRFIMLRADSHAQKEIQDYALAIVDLIKPIVPVSIRAWAREVTKGIPDDEHSA